MEFAFLGDRIPKLTIQFLLELGEIIARTLLNLKMNLRTQHLLEESQKMTEELQSNEVQLQENAEEMKSAQSKLGNCQHSAGRERSRRPRMRRTDFICLLEHASEIISIYDDEFNLTYISPSVINIFGYSVEEMMAGKDMERIGRDDANQLRKTLERLRETPDRY